MEHPTATQLAIILFRIRNILHADDGDIVVVFSQESITMRPSLIRINNQIDMQAWW